MLSVEVLILIAILAETAWSIYDRWKTNKRDQESLGILKEIKETLEESNAELADIRDTAVEDEVE